MKILNKMQFILALLLIILMQIISVPVPKAYAANAVDLGAAASFSVLAALSMSAAAPGTSVEHDLGLSPGLEISRTGPWTVGGNQYFGPSSLAFNAQADALNAFNILAGEPTNGVWSTNPWSPAPGVWTVASDTTFTGTITLNGGYDDVWVFQVGRDMTFSGSVVMAGNAQPCHVFWQVSRNATISSGSTFIGTLIASSDITLASGATVDGRIISLNSSLTTDGNNVSGPVCAAAPTSMPTPTPTPTSALTPTPTPTTSPDSTPTPTPTSTPTSFSTSSSSNSTPVCTEFIPTSNPDLFQIDRAGSTAVLHFTPVNNNMTYYYIAYGLSPGSEQYGVTFPASPSTGAVTYTINDLNPNLTYYFKVRAGNICAPGGWSNNRESNSKNPSLPNTGFAPHENNIPWAGISVD